MKVSFGYEKSSFSGKKYGQDPCVPLAQPPRLLFHFGLCVIHILHVCFLKQMPRRQKFGKKLLRKSHKNQTQKIKFLEQNAAKIVLLEKKIFFNFCSNFVKKKKTIKVYVCFTILQDISCKHLAF